MFDLHITVAISALIYAIRCKPFKMSLSKILPKSVTELLTWGEKYINMEETIYPRKISTTTEMPEHKRQHESNPRRDLAQGKQKQDIPSTSFTHLNTSRSNILMEIKDLKEWHSTMGPILTVEIRTIVVSFIEIIGIPQRHTKPCSTRSSLWWREDS